MSTDIYTRTLGLIIRYFCILNNKNKGKKTAIIHIQRFMVWEVKLKGNTEVSELRICSCTVPLSGGMWHFLIAYISSAATSLTKNSGLGKWDLCACMTTGSCNNWIRVWQVILREYPRLLATKSTQRLNNLFSKADQNY